MAEVFEGAAKKKHRIDGTTFHSKPGHLILESDATTGSRGLNRATIPTPISIVFTKAHQLRSAKK